MKGTKRTFIKPIIIRCPYTGEVWTEYKGKKITVDTDGLDEQSIHLKLQNEWYKYYNNDK